MSFQIDVVKRLMSKRDSPPEETKSTGTDPMVKVDEIELIDGHSFEEEFVQLDLHP